MPVLLGGVQLVGPVDPVYAVLSPWCADTMQAVDDLSFEVQAANVGIKNAANAFSLLSHKQFVENRVAEPGGGPELGAPRPPRQFRIVTVLNPRGVFGGPEPEPEPEPESDPALTGTAARVRRYSDALQMGLAAMKASPKWVSMHAPVAGEAEHGGSATQSPTPANPYCRRPLPFIIGTPEYIDDDMCGKDLASRRCACVEGTMRVGGRRKCASLRCCAGVRCAVPSAFCVCRC